MANTSQSVAHENVTKSTKLRHLKLKSFSKIADILNIENRWLEVAMRIKGPDKRTDLFYSSDICKLQDEWKRGGSPAEAFLHHWSTTGLPSEHPSVGKLIDILIEAELYLAANSISEEFFQVPVSPTVLGVKTEEVLADIQNFKLKNINEVDFTLTTAKNNIEDLKKTSPSHLDDGLINFSYEYLQQLTKNFCDISILHGGFKIGEGGFGTVYRAYVNGQWLAVKKLKNEVDKQFFTELECLRKFKHENLLPLFGFSNNGPYSCLVYLYMENGSLQEKLFSTADAEPIQWPVRLNIAYGSAKGINHLHTFDSQPLVHRDIKSANVLLDKNFVPKVGDFGLARIGSGNQSAAFTSNVFGTSVYMAPEAFHGEVSVKLDSFSYGVILMELLTSLPPYDADREEKDLVSYLDENLNQAEDIVTLLDSKAGQWDTDIAISLYKISLKCVERRKRDRPTIGQILPELEKLKVNL